jgi:predicted SPOUT superfamily RNA methylase MTH1
MTDLFTACQSRINRVRSVANELYYAREEGATTLRTLDTHEALFISACDAIQREAIKERSKAEETWGYATNACEALCNLSYRNEAAKMEQALASYRAECERREFPDDDEVSQLTAAE